MRKKLVFALTALLLSGVLCACSSQGSTFEAKTYTADSEAVTGIHIQAADREILVLPAEDEQIHIDYAQSPKEFYDLSLSESGILTMVSKSGKTWTDYIGSSPSAGADIITLRLPAAALSTLTLITTKENITLSALTVTDQITLRTNGGDIFFQELDAGNAITLENKNGSITGAILGSYDDFSITCTIKKGETNLPQSKTGGSKTLTATNNNGNIDIAFVSNSES